MVNAAAYTAVDQAESEAELALSRQRDRPRGSRFACATIGAPLIHVRPTTCSTARNRAVSSRTIPSIRSAPTAAARREARRAIRASTA